MKLKEKCNEVIFSKHAIQQMFSRYITTNNIISSLDKGEIIADICNNCGEYYLSEDVTESLLKKAETVVKNNVELEIIQYAA